MILSPPDPDFTQKIIYKYNDKIFKGRKGGDIRMAEVKKKPEAKKPAAKKAEPKKPEAKKPAAKKK